MWSFPLFMCFLPAAWTAFFRVPPGNALHELLHLPGYWLKLARTDTRHLEVRRIRYGAHFRQYFLFLPPPAHITRPDKLIIYFHGGGWAFGRPEKFTASVLPFHDAGYAVVLPSLRRTPQYNYYDIRADLDQLLPAVLALQEQLGCAGQKIVLSGMSAGGNVAALLGLDRRALAAIKQNGSVFAGLLLCAAPLDLDQMHDSPLLRAFAGRRDSRQFQLANPARHLSNPPPPVFCIHGTQDGLVAYDSTARFVELLERRYPGTTRFITLPEGTHLEVAAWGHDRPELKREILSWLKKL